ncbi:MAG TPA: ABC transporter ATP-binding protein [Gammaproteobacteria bacterium]|nr:ABC transporter ATP-binding protein [Gammaproteobacteria bacterium]
MVDIQGLSFSYRGQPLFRDISLSLAPGNIYGLLGVNGAGKSTLLKLMTGLLFPESGVVRSFGHDPARREPSFLGQVFMLPEDVDVPRLSAHDYVAGRAPFYPAFDHARLERYLRDFDLPANPRLAALSHGQKKKFLLAFGLASNAPLVVLDEPTNGLDIPSKTLFRRIVAEALTDRRLFVISTHQVRDVGALIDPIVILHGGRVVLNRTLGEITDKVRMTHSGSPPAPGAAGLLFSEQAVGGYWSVWHGSSSDGGPLDLEVLFNTVIADPERSASLFGQLPAAGAAS